MSEDNAIVDFLSGYPEPVHEFAVKLRQLVLANLPAVTEQLDLPAKMVAYCYSQKYVDLICVIIPSQKGLKLGFNRGSTLADPDGLLKGEGKITRYVEIHSEHDIHSPLLKKLLEEALRAYRSRT